MFRVTGIGPMRRNAPLNIGRDSFTSRTPRFNLLTLINSVIRIVKL